MTCPRLRCPQSSPRVVLLLIQIIEAVFADRTRWLRRWCSFGRPSPFLPDRIADLGRLDPRKRVENWAAPTGHRRRQSQNPPQPLKTRPYSRNHRPSLRKPGRLPRTPASRPRRPPAPRHHPADSRRALRPTGMIASPHERRNSRCLAFLAHGGRGYQICLARHPHGCGEQLAPLAGR